MRYLLAILFSFAAIQFTMAQDDDSYSRSDCAPDSYNQNMDQSSTGGQEDFARGNQEESTQSQEDFSKSSDTEYNSDLENQSQSETDLNKENSTDLNSGSNDVQSQSSTDLSNDQTDLGSADMSQPDQVGTENYGQSETDTQTKMESETTVSQSTVNGANDCVDVSEVRTSDDSKIGNILEAPFKAGFSVVSETAEGVGHIVGAPFKGVRKLFGDDDNPDE